MATVVAAVVLWWLSPGPQQARRNLKLFEAVQVGDVKLAEALLDAGAEVNRRDADGITPLMQAARGRRPNISDPAPTDHPEVVELLIKRGADVNAKTDSGFEALFWAARYGHVRTAKVLIDHGADVNAKDQHGLTALKWAATNKQTNMIELLKASGARE
jgi:ankyrin repeat protein